MERKIRLQVPPSLTPDHLRGEVTRYYGTAAESVTNSVQSFYDTFDWRLYRRGLVLCREGNTYHLLSREASEPILSAISDTQAKPRFWREFPPGPLRNRLCTYLDIRALLHLTSIQKKTHSFWVINRRQQSILRVVWEEIWSVHRKVPIPLQRALVLEPAPGHRQEVITFRNHLTALEIEQEAPDDFLVALDAIDVIPGSYSAKIDIALQPDMPARLATCTILDQLLQTIRQNQKGIQLDIDPEFLHDFRVAVRRTRVVLSQIKEVLPPEIAGSYKQEFATLGRATNRLRDLDVSLLKQDSYRTLLPEPLWPGLDLMFRTITTERRAELIRVVQLLRQETTRDMLARWQGVLVAAASNELPPSPTSAEPTLALARRFIHQQYLKVLRSAQDLDTSTSDAEIHRLRIECKKLRYLLEFFASLFPRMEISQLVKELKKLQDVLGDHHDLSVQQEDLGRHLASIKGRSRLSLLQAAAVGGLIARLNDRQRTHREEVRRALKIFRQQEHSELYQELFGPA